MQVAYRILSDSLRWMNQRLTQLLQLLMMVSLLAMPSTAVSCPSVTKIQQPGMACCGPDCPCPTGKICPTTFTQIDDRAIDRASTEIAGKAATPVLYFLIGERKWGSTKSVVLTDAEPRPPPLLLGSPLQAKLQVWLL